MISLPSSSISEYDSPAGREPCHVVQFAAQRQDATGPFLANDGLLSLAKPIVGLGPAENPGDLAVAHLR